MSSAAIGPGSRMNFPGALPHRTYTSPKRSGRICNSGQLSSDMNSNAAVTGSDAQRSSNNACRTAVFPFTKRKRKGPNSGAFRSG